MSLTQYLLGRAAEFGLDAGEDVYSSMFAALEECLPELSEHHYRAFSAGLLHGLSRVVCYCLASAEEGSPEFQQEIRERLSDWRKAVRQAEFFHDSPGSPMLITTHLHLQSAKDYLVGADLSSDVKALGIMLAEINEQQRQIMTMLVNPPRDRDNLFPGVYE